MNNTKSSKSSKNPSSNLKKHESKYKMKSIVGQGTFGKVYKAFKPKNPDNYYAIKKISLLKQNNEVDGFPLTSIREIKLLKELKHPNVVRLHEIFTSRGTARKNFVPTTFIVMEYMEHDLWSLEKYKWGFKEKEHRIFTIPEIKNLLFQILSGIEHLHQKQIIHRDLKGANLLLNKKGELKLADFGLGRWLNSHNKNLTKEVVTFPYRAPEITYGYKSYDDKIDIWSIGCIFAELLIGTVLFAQKDPNEQIKFMYELLGDPRDSWPEVI